ncbi:MAG: hypothetical protein K2M87_06905 [Muribaculaceae bacterium]|nr:hypothetical protein [Muribaculaceae bacterium]
MKLLSTLLIAAGMTSACAVAQNVTVFMKDNTVHKYNAEYLSDISFREVTPQPGSVQMETIDLNVYGQGNVGVTLENADKTIFCYLDLYGTTDAIFLQPGVYNVVSGSDPYRIDPDARYTYVLAEGVKTAITGGSLTISIGNDALSSPLRVVSDNHVYHITADFELADGKEFKATYTGDLSYYTPWISAMLSGASYNANPQPQGQFYVKFNDENWGYDIAMVFQADASATTLPAGTYTFTELPATGSLLASSYVDSYKPNSHSTMLEGSQVIVTLDGENYNMQMNLKLSDGREGTFTYTGPISGTPTFTESKIDLQFASVEFPYTGNNTGIKLFNADKTECVALDCLGLGSSAWFLPGTYTIGASEGLYIDNDVRYTYYSKTENDQTSSIGFKSGTLTVALDNDVYTMTLSGVLNDAASTKITGVYTGKLSVFGPTVDMTLSAASYNANKQLPGTFYIKFNDADWKCEMAMVFHLYPFTTQFSAADFTYATTGDPFTFDQNSYVDLYNPNSSNRMADGSTIKVTQDGNVFTFDMNLIFTDGRKGHFTYTGEISGTPAFKPSPINETLTNITVSQVDEEEGTCNLVLWTGTSVNNWQKKLSLDLTGPANAAYLQPGTYTYGATGEFAIGDDAATNYYKYKYQGSTKTKDLKSGTLKVSLEGSTYTFVFDGIADDGDDTEIHVTCTGELNTFGPTVETALSSATYSTAKQYPGTYLINFGTANNSCEVGISFHLFPYTPAFDAADYTYNATSNEPFTFDQNSYVTIFGQKKAIADGSTIKATKDGSDFNITMNLILTDGSTYTFTYTGAISGTPLFKDAPINETLPNISVSNVDEEEGTCTLTLYSGSSINNWQKRLNLDLTGPANAAYLQPGTYTYGATGEFAIGDDAATNYYKYKYQGSTKTKDLKSGTLTVTLEGATYTFVFDGLIDDADETPIKITATGVLNAFGPAAQ